MSEVFEVYERQYCELSDNLTRSCTSASILHGERKKWGTKYVFAVHFASIKALDFLHWLCREIQMHPSSKCSGFCSTGFSSTGKMLFLGYCEITATVSIELKKQKLSEIKEGLDEADALIRKMDLEARSLQPSINATLLAKLREYKHYLNNLKTDVKRITSTNTNQAARDELLESGIDGTTTVSADQKGRLLMSTERLNQSTDRIKESRRTMLETEELGVSILQDLHQQRQSLLHAHSTLHAVDDNISKSKKILTTISRRINKNKLILSSIIGALILAILIILYIKLVG
ncbi:hypothetical protein Goari_027181 [Gossypium aridum]|uniref:Vesicle transport v-SNARE N-terminal domain-containing protein n=1 Tax=Gossypium aridum TaxID=34290 RepID=A0A7J8YUI8_GOSAI|nr:hypothetical protein [Gossypium aridum]